MKALAVGIGRTSVLGQCLAAAFICAPADFVGAATNSSQFAVTATFISADNPIQPESAFCQTAPSLAFGALVTVVCTTGEVVNLTAPVGDVPGVPLRGGSYRFILPNSFSFGFPDFYTGSFGHGVASSWRVIQVADRNYYEFLLRW
jgi:hypothetical protein